MSSLEPVVKNETNYGFSFLKTGYQDIYPSITKDFALFGIEVVQAKELVFAPEVIDYMYRDSLSEPFYPHMRTHLSNHAFIVMALEMTDTATPCQTVLHGLKNGSMGYVNLRQKYHREEDTVSDEDFESWCRGEHPNQDALTIALTQRNVFHAADNSEEAYKTLSLLGLYNPEFFSPLKKARRSRALARLTDTLELLSNLT